MANARLQAECNKLWQKKAGFKIYILAAASRCDIDPGATIFAFVFLYYGCVWYKSKETKLKK